MAIHDTIGDFLTIIRNASAAKKRDVCVHWSRVREGISSILKAEGYISGVNITSDDKNHKYLVLKLKYVGGKPAIVGIRRHSKPGSRLYYQSNEIPKVLGGLGTPILTTSKGLLTGSDAKKNNVGGELLAEVW